MEDSKELTLLLARIDQASQKQAKYAKWQCIFSAAAAVFCGAVLVIALALLPTVSDIAQQANAVMEDARQISSQVAQADWEGLVTNLEQVSEQMAQADLGSIAQDVAELVQTTQVSVEEALGKLNAIDLEKLNQAVSDLAAVVEPLAKFVSRF